MTTEPKLCLVLNDTHCGSEFGLLPDEVELDDGRNIGFHKNKRLGFLWQSWLDMREAFFRLAGNDPFTLVLNGDLIEGFHHRSDELVAAKISEHLTIAKVAIGPFIEMAENTVVTKGTQCHTMDWEVFLCKEYGLPPAKDFQQFTVNGVLVDARHHMPTAGTVQLESGAMSKILVNNMANAVRAGHPVPRILLRAHRHVTGDFCDGESMLVCPGPWQYNSRHCYKVVPDAIPRFSAYALDFRGQKEGTLPARHSFCYTPPFDILNS